MIKEIEKALTKSEIFNSKFVYIYSDFRNFFQYYKKNLDLKVIKFLNIFLKRNITCIVPAFSYETNGYFNVNYSKSKVGFLSNFIIKKINHERSSHPIFSYIAIGKRKSFIKKLGTSAFGKNSLHSYLLNKNCFFFHLNRSLSKGNTLIHHIEQKNKVKYRYEKTFDTKVIKDKKIIRKKFKAFVRKNMQTKTSLGTFTKAYKIIKKKKYFFKKKIGRIEILIYAYDRLYNDLDKLIKTNPSIFIKSNY